MKKFVIGCILALGLVAFNACDSESTLTETQDLVSNGKPVTPTPPRRPVTPPTPVHPNTPTPPVVEPETPPIGAVQEFIPFAHDLYDGDAWILADYEALAAQETLYIGDLRSSDNSQNIVAIHSGA